MIYQTVLQIEELFKFSCQLFKIRPYYRSCVRQSWQGKVEDYTDRANNLLGEFKPDSEARIDCFVYSWCLSNVYVTVLSVRKQA
jgi:hypothetical protein